MLYIKHRDYLKILQYCKNLFPYEACGLVSGIKNGREKYIKKIYFMENTDASINHFTMDIKEQFVAVKDMHKNGMQLIGSFHSHPAAAAMLSEEDKRLAYDFNVNYMVLSLMDIKHPVLKAFNIDKWKNVTEETICYIYGKL